MDAGIARLARVLPCVTRRWTQAPTGYNFFPWQGQKIDSPYGASWTSDDDVHAITPPAPINGLFFAPTVVPAAPITQVNGPITVGNDFLCTVPGRHLVGIWFYKLASEAITSYPLTVYRVSDMSVLASATATTVPAEVGWHYTPLATPLTLTANDQMRIVVYHSGANYVSTTGGAMSDTVLGAYKLIINTGYALGPPAPPTTSIIGYYYYVDIATDDRPTKVDVAQWDSWVNGPDRIGATSLTTVAANDTLYVSGTGWTNIPWASLKAGNRVQIMSADGVTLYQDWTATTDYVAQAPGGHFNVTGTLLTVPATASQIQAIWIT